MGLWVLLALALAAIVGVRLFKQTLGVEAGGSSHPAVGKKLTSLSLQQLTPGTEGANTTSVTLSDLQGGVTLVNFWGTWCPPCRLEFPHLVELAEGLQQRKDFRLLSVSCSGSLESDDSDVEAATAAFLREHQAHFPTWRDAEGKSRRELIRAASLDGFAYPTTVILDHSGTILGLWMGYQDGDEVAMRTVIDRAVEASAKAND